MVDTAATFAQFDALLTTFGLRPALAYLLSLTDYRYIAIFRFQDGRAAAAVFYDSEAPDQLTTDEVPDTATYCCFVRDSRGVFSVADALTDPRTASHPAHEAVRAYCGVPVMTPEGEILGTLCHYDTQPRDATRIDLDLMLQVASRLANSGLVPPYPRQRDNDPPGS